MRRQLRLLPLAALCLWTLGLSGCSPSSGSSQAGAADASAGQAAASTSGASEALFVDVAERAGIRFKHALGDTGHFYFIEPTPSGCAFLDFDGDGFLDIFLVQSGPSDPPAQVKARPFCALYRNKRDGTFEDVTPGSGIDRDLGYAQGAAVADYDNDGRPDIFVTSYAGNHLLRNVGGGKFSDVSAKLGLAQVRGTSYSTSAAWGDYDADGRLDLYVCYYSQWTHATDKPCRDKDTGQLDYCYPHLYEPVTHRLYHNTPRGFVDVSVQSGITGAKGRGLAVAWTDFNGDGRPDIFVANDVTPNMLWRNDGGGRFTNVASQAGCAYDSEGRGIASMGIAVGDYNRSGRQSLYISNFSARPNILFQNVGGSFEDVTMQARLSTVHLKYLSFGCEFLDYDADGWLDLVANNGHVQMSERNREPGVTIKQRKQLLRNERGTFFREVTDPAALGDMATPTLGRGLAVGDYDNDGRLDILAMAQNGPAQLFHNQARARNHWISFRTIGTKSNRDGAHAKFELRASGARQTAEVRAGTSYLSSSDKRVYFGLGDASKADQVVVTWPSGARDVLNDVRADRFYTITEGRGVTRVEQPKG